MRSPISDDIMFLIMMTFAACTDPNGIGMTVAGASLVCTSIWPTFWALTEATALKVAVPEFAGALGGVHWTVAVTVTFVGILPRTGKRKPIAVPSRTLRIYFIGAHSTGKTTMARYVADKYKIPLLTEVARSMLAERELSMETLRSDLEVVDSFQKGIFFRQVQVERDRDSFVSDRSFDNLAYAAQHSRVLRGVLETREARSYVEDLRKKDVIIFFVRPVKSTMQDDGIREQVVWDELNRIDGMVKFMLEMWGLSYYQISTGGMQERARLVDAVISGHSPHPGRGRVKNVRRA